LTDTPPRADTQRAEPMGANASDGRARGRHHAHAAGVEPAPHRAPRRRRRCPRGTGV